MKLKFEIEVKNFKTIHKLPESWSKQDLITILELSDFEVDPTSSEADLYEYISMVFGELEPEEAAQIVLNHVFGEKLNKNQIKEIATEMMEENLWEEYGDMSLHEDLFKITSLLYHSYNGKFPNPNAADVLFKITALNHDAEIALKRVDEKLIARIIAKGMSEHAVINRMFHDNVEGGDWAEAKDIIWQFLINESLTKSIELELTTAVYWVKELKDVDSYAVELLAD
ncbi:hypothetical protein N8987_03510 [Crocinitomix sp.]|nr:hypothetical protein [Crocinitomix sp.]